MSPQVSVRQSERRARTRARLLDAAYRVFSREGYHGATLDSIAADAGVSKGGLYYSFDSKQELFYALLEERLAARAAEIRSEPDAARPPGVSPERWASGAVAEMRFDLEWNVLFWEFACVAARERGSGRRLAERLRSFRAGAAVEMQRMIEGAGIDSAVPYERLARIMAALANGIALDVMVEVGENSEAEARETMATAMALLWRGTASMSTPGAGGDGR
jgi:AcrR family transcriptional regulator